MIAHLFLDIASKFVFLGSCEEMIKSIPKKELLTGINVET
jgi:hypothetical protein